MCTVVAWPTPDGYLLAFNRDELLSRPAAVPPRDLGGFLAPIDPEGGGSWLAVNQHGITTCALNVYEAAVHEPAAPVRSRGLLVTELATASTLDTWTARIRAFAHLAHTRPFHLLAVAPSQQVVEARWDGAELCVQAARLPLLRVSAAFDAAAVRAARALEFVDLQQDLARTTDLPGTVRLWFASHELHGAPRGTCMHREPLAATVSHSQVRVDARSVGLHYLAGPPCQPDTEGRSSARAVHLLRA